MSLPAGVRVLRQLWWVDPLNRSAGVAIDGSETIVAGMTELWRVEMDVLIERRYLAAWQGFLAARQGRRVPITLSPRDVDGDPWRPTGEGLPVGFTAEGGSGGSDFNDDFNDDFGGSSASQITIFDDGGEPVIFAELGTAVVRSGNIAGARSLTIRQSGMADEWLPGHFLGVSGRAYRVATATPSGDEVAVTFEPALHADIAAGTVLDVTPEANLRLLDDRQGRVGPSFDVYETVTLELVERVA